MDYSSLFIPNSEFAAAFDNIPDSADFHPYAFPPFNYLNFQAGGQVSPIASRVIGSTFKTDPREAGDQATKHRRSTSATAKRQQRKQTKHSDVLKNNTHPPPLTCLQTPFVQTGGDAAESGRKRDRKLDPFAPECSIPLPFQIGDEYGYYEPSSIWKRNERERHRVRCVNDGYDKLRNHLPFMTAEKRLSKVETLRLAIRYIRHLEKMLADPLHLQCCDCNLLMTSTTPLTSANESADESDYGDDDGRSYNPTTSPCSQADTTAS